MDIEEVRKTLHRYHAAWVAEGIPDSVSDIDKINYQDNLGPPRWTTSSSCSGATIRAPLMFATIWATAPFTATYSATGRGRRR